jgi:ribosomal protein S18 acetylase RimI-like enzyme
MADGPELRVVAVDDERSPLAAAAFALIHEAMWDVQPTGELMYEVEEKRRGLPAAGDYHLLALVDQDDNVAASAAGVYLEPVNAGFVTYLAVSEERRGLRLGRELRAALVEAFREEARRRRGTDLAWVVGEVRHENRWLGTLVREGEAIPFDLPYFHPWLPMRAEGKYVLYREPVSDERPELPRGEVEGLLYTIWRRAYRIRYPLDSDTFRYMLRALEGRETIGPHPSFGFEEE